MKKLMIYTLLTAFMVGFMAFDADAQYRIRKKKKKKKKPKQDEYFEENRFSTQNLWYGGSADFPRFSSFNGSSIFAFGISPMVGYKIIDPISVGLRGEMSYYYEKIIDFGGNYKYESISYGFGPFTRARVWNIFFHGEYNFRSVASPYDENNRGPFIDPNDPQKIQNFRYPVNELNLGLGYTSGDILAYEIYILYNTLSDINDNNGGPWDFRLGLTYKF